MGSSEIWGVRGVYLIADTPEQATPLATEDGDGDRQLLRESLENELTQEEQDRLAEDLHSQTILSDD
jgi:hypothetical protein